MTDLIVLVEVGGLRPGWRFTEPEGPWPGVHRPGSFLSLRCWMDRDGTHVWQAHDCAYWQRSVGMLPWPTWQRIDAGRIEPSINCGDCGLHAFGEINAAWST